MLTSPQSAFLLGFTKESFDWVGGKLQMWCFGAQVCAEGEKGVTLMMINGAFLLMECHLHQHVHFKAPNEVKPPVFTCCIFLMPDFNIILKSTPYFSH